MWKTKYGEHTRNIVNKEKHQAPSWPLSLSSLHPHPHTQWSSWVGAFSCPSLSNHVAQIRHNRQRTLPTFYVYSSSSLELHLTSSWYHLVPVWQQFWMNLEWRAPSHPLPTSLSFGWSISWAETHLPIVPGARVDPVLVPLVDEAIIIHNILLSLWLTVQVDSVP